MAEYITNRGPAATVDASTFQLTGEHAEHHAGLIEIEGRIYHPLRVLAIKDQPETGAPKEEIASDGK